MGARGYVVARYQVPEDDLFIGECQVVFRAAQAVRIEDIPVEMIP